MNLLQLAAIKVTAWPEGADRVVQSDKTGRIMFDADFGFGATHDFECSEIAEDAYDASITRAQWEAERARIAAMDGVSAAPEQANAEAERDHQAQYEQELWDLVAIKSLHGILASTSEWDEDGAVECSARIADLFMAERAKRLKGVK